MALRRFLLANASRLNTQRVPALSTSLRGVSNNPESLIKKTQEDMKWISNLPSLCESGPA